MPRSVVVLGAGIVGVSAALHLRRRGWDVVLVDRQGPGEGTSFGNAGLIQKEAVFPYAFPRAMSDLRRIAGNRAIDVSYHPLALPRLASPLLRYWWHSHPDRYAQAVLGHSRLIATSLDEHLALAREAGAEALLRPIGWLTLFGDEAKWAEAVAKAEVARRDYGVNYTVLDPTALEAMEPHLRPGKAGAIHWTDTSSVSDPHALTIAYATLFTRQGGTIAVGDAASLARDGTGWTVRTDAGPVAAQEAVVALGAASTRVTGPLGYKPPLFGKRGYHVHFGLKGNAVLNRPMLDLDSGFMMAPMRRGVRMTTGAEFAPADAPATPVQVARATPVARSLLPLADQVEETPWMGTRPCMPDMVPVIGKAPGYETLWCAFGHGHQGLTLGPTTGRLLAEMMTGERPFLDAEPYRADRF